MITINREDMFDKKGNLLSQTIGARFIRFITTKSFMIFFTVIAISIMVYSNQTETINFLNNYGVSILVGIVVVGLIVSLPYLIVKIFKGLVSFFTSVFFIEKMMELLYVVTTGFIGVVVLVCFLFAVKIVMGYSFSEAVVYDFSDKGTYYQILGVSVLFWLMGGANWSDYASDNSTGKNAVEEHFDWEDEEWGKFLEGHTTTYGDGYGSR